jgi:hypothetical protein
MQGGMQDVPVLAVREEKPPLWAVLAPPLYLFACAFAIRSVAMDRSIDVGLCGLLVAVGLAPAFAMPAIFSTRSMRLAASDDGLIVDGSLVKINGVRLGRADRGAARLIVETRDGSTRTFLVPSYKDAQQLMSLLPPVSAPAGALAA